MLSQSNSARHKFPLQAAYPCQPLPHVRGFPALRVIWADPTPRIPSVPSPSGSGALPVTPSAGAQEPPGSPKFLTHLSIHATCLPTGRRPEDPGGFPHPGQYRMLHMGFVLVNTLANRNKLHFGAVPALQGVRPPLWPVWFLRVRFTCLVRPVLRIQLMNSATGATLDTGGWPILTRRGLPPRKMRQACLAQQRRS